LCKGREVHNNLLPLLFSPLHGREARKERDLNGSRIDLTVRKLCGELSEISLLLEISFESAPRIVLSVKVLIARKRQITSKTDMKVRSHERVVPSIEFWREARGIG